MDFFFFNRRKYWKTWGEYLNRYLARQMRRIPTMGDESRYDGDAGERPNAHNQIFSSHFLNLTVFNDNRRSSIHRNIRFLIHVKATRMEKRLRRKAIHSASRKRGWMAWNGFHPHSFFFVIGSVSQQLRPSVYQYVRPLVYNACALRPIRSD